MNEVILLSLLDVVVVGVDVLVVVFIIEFFEKFGEGVFDFLWGAFEVDAGELFDEFSSVVGYAGDGGVRKVINAVAQSITFDFLMDGERAALIVVVKLHLRGVEAGFAFDEVADSGVFYDHA